MAVNDRMSRRPHRVRSKRTKSRRNQKTTTATEQNSLIMEGACSCSCCWLWIRKCRTIEQSESKSCVIIICSFYFPRFSHHKQSIEETKVAPHQLVGLFFLSFFFQINTFWRLAGGYDVTWNNIQYKKSLGMTRAGRGRSLPKVKRLSLLEKNRWAFSVRTSPNRNKQWPTQASGYGIQKRLPPRPIVPEKTKDGEICTYLRNATKVLDFSDIPRFVDVSGGSNSSGEEIVG